MWKLPTYPGTVLRDGSRTVMGGWKAAPARLKEQPNPVCVISLVAPRWPILVFKPLAPNLRLVDLIKTRALPGVGMKHSLTVVMVCLTICLPDPLVLSEG